MDRTEQLKNLVENCRDLILKTERDIWASPETGYHEWKTNAYMEKLFEDLGYTLTKAGDIPGFYTDVETGKPGPKVAILGELDSLICGNHPDADPETKAVHACGHNAQCATLAGVARGFKAARSPGRIMRLHPPHGRSRRGADPVGLQGGPQKAGNDPLLRRQGGIYLPRLF